MTEKINISKSELIENKLNELEFAKNHNKYWNITKEQGDFLSKIILEENPKNILEIGTSNGYSTLYLAKNLNEISHITTIEVNTERFEISKKNFEDCNLNQNITQIKGEITEILNSEILDNITNNMNNSKFDFIFLDAMQREYLNIIKQLEEKRLLTNNAIIIADNVLSHGNMSEFKEYMNKNYKKTSIIDLGGGFLIAKKT